jgi:hypothetical protein
VQVFTLSICNVINICILIPTALAEGTYKQPLFQ